jgi:hypothetical protein
MTTRIEYSSVCLRSKARVLAGRGCQEEIAAVNGIKIVRIIDGPEDFLVFEGPYVVPGIEIPWSNVASYVRAPKPTLRGKGGKASDVDD